MKKLCFHHKEPIIQTTDKALFWPSLTDGIKIYKEMEVLKCPDCEKELGLTDNSKKIMINDMNESDKKYLTKIESCIVNCSNCNIKPNVNIKNSSNGKSLYDITCYKCWHHFSGQMGDDKGMLAWNMKNSYFFIKPTFIEFIKYFFNKSKYPSNYKGIHVLRDFAQSSLSKDNYMTEFIKRNELKLLDSAINANQKAGHDGIEIESTYSIYRVKYMFYENKLCIKEILSTIIC